LTVFGGAFMLKKSFCSNAIYRIIGAYHNLSVREGRRGVGSFARVERFQQSELVACREYVHFPVSVDEIYFSVSNHGRCVKVMYQFVFAAQFAGSGVESGKHAVIRRNVNVVGGGDGA